MDKSPYAWLWEPLLDEPSLILRSMFGTKALYLDGRLHCCFASKSETWRGLLVATDEARHAALRKDIPTLHTHPVLPKWLYLAEVSENFESNALELLRLIRVRDPRIGVLPKSKKRGSRSGKRG